MKDSIYRWLETMGQEPRMLFRDAVCRIAIFAFLMTVILAPVILVSDSFKPALFPPKTARNADFPPEGLVPLVLVGIYLFVTIVLTLSFMGGWWKLAAKFPAPENFGEGQLFKRQRGSVGGTRYGRILNIGVSESGLYLKCLFPFSFIQRPLLIPWKEIKAINEVRFLWQKSSFIIVGSPKICSIILKNKNVVLAVRETWEAHN